MKTKPFWQSWTCWFNVLTLAAVFFGFFPDSKLAMEGLAVVNVLLRFKTNNGISLT